MSTKIKLQIKNRFTGRVIFEYEKENNTLAETINEYVKIANEKYERANLTDADLTRADLTRADLTDADLTRADLTRADLTRADLTDANLTRADLTDANLTDANLTDANLTDANLTDANLTSIKNDMFIVLLHSIPEIQFLKQNIIDGNIDGSTYDGKCACLSGTLVNGAKLHNGEKEEKITKNIMDCRDSSRPIEVFFMSIKRGHTPDNSQFSKLALQWIEEFEFLIAV